MTALLFLMTLLVGFFIGAITVVAVCVRMNLDFKIIRREPRPTFEFTEDSNKSATEPDAHIEWPDYRGQ